MTNKPDDLIPLPTTPYDQRPASLALDAEECRTALWENEGNITRAAEMLKITSSRLRAFVKGSAYLTREMDEARERIIDQAEAVVVDALNGPPERSDTMARFVLGGLGKNRGYGAASQGGGKISVGNINISWGDGSSVTEAGGTLIEGEVTDA